MAIQQMKSSLAAAGSTGNNTHASFQLSGMSERVGVNFRITAVGATPTVTFKIQGSYDDPSVADGSADWFDMSFIDAAATTITAATVGATKTAVGAYPYYFPGDLPIRRIRLVTSANTNVTYTADVVEQQH
ncbi:MAG: hypothetical protein LC118_07950 [Dehalococcoidia bacterium]|nr:hypothetical protein [Dehalococcoidia bacterium]